MSLEQIVDSLKTPTQSFLVAYLYKDLRNPSGWANLVSELNRINRLDDALVLGLHAFDLDPQSAHVNFCLACTYDLLGQDDKAEELFERAYKFNPNLPELERGMSGFYLSRERFTEGAKHFYKRLSEKHGRPRTKPTWDGEDGRVLVTAEQGIGDQILFLTAELPENCIIESDARLCPLVGRFLLKQTLAVPGLGTLSTPLTTTPFDYQISAGELFLRNYLKPKRQWLSGIMAEAKIMRETYKKASLGKPVIGLSWNSANTFMGQEKSIPLIDFYQIMKIPGPLWLNVQYDGRHQEVAEFNTATKLLFVSDPEVDHVNNFESGLKQIAACDFIITVSNTVAHMAGAIGVPVALLCPRAQGRLWYWFQGREDSPIYPSMRIFRQDKDFSWDSAIQQAAKFVGIK